MRIIAVIDTNVLVSSLISHGNSPPSRIIDEIFSGSVVPIYNDYLIGEYHEVLSREKFGFKQENVNILLRSIMEYGIRIDTVSSDIVLDDMKDVPIFELLLATHSMNSYLITGNVRNFPKIDNVITPKEATALLDTEEMNENDTQ